MINKRIKYNRNEVMRSRFLQLPCFLFEEKEFRNLSNDARILYALLKNRNELSIANGWCDENDNVYQIFTRKEMMKLLNASDKTVTKAMKDLRKFKLIEEQRMGQGIPNRIYLLTLESLSRSKNRIFYDSRTGKNTNPESENLRPNNNKSKKTERRKTENEEKNQVEESEKNNSPDIVIERKEKSIVNSVNNKQEEVNNTIKSASTLSTDDKIKNKNISCTEYSTVREDKSIGFGVVREKNFLVVEDTHSEVLEEREKEGKTRENVDFEKVAKNIIEESAQKIRVAKKNKEKPTTPEELKQSETIVNSLSECITRRTKKETCLSDAQKAIDSIVYWLRQGFKINDFLKIINLKVRTWLGTPMATQLKPSVIFSLKNFREYLDETKLEEFTNPIYKQDNNNDSNNFENNENKSESYESSKISNENEKQPQELQTQESQNQDNKEIELAFEQVYSAYPKKQKKLEAFLEFKNAFFKIKNKNISIESLLQAIENLIEYYRLKKIDNRYIPFLGNWLKCERWNDKYDLKKIINPKNKFANFEQRTWDFKKIERLAQGDFD